MAWRFGVVLLLIYVAIGVSAPAANRIPAKAYACARLAPVGLPNFPHTCALVKPAEDGTAQLWLQRAGQTYEYCRVSAPYNPAGIYCQ